MLSLNYLTTILNNYKFLDFKDKRILFTLICLDLTRKEQELDTTKKIIKYMKSEIEMIETNIKNKKNYIIG